MRTDWRPAFLGLVRKGKTNRAAAELLELHRDTPYARVRRGDRDFARKWLDAKASAAKRAA